MFGRYYWPEFVLAGENLLIGDEVKNSLGGKELPLGFFGRYFAFGTFIWYLAR